MNTHSPTGWTNIFFARDSRGNEFAIRLSNKDITSMKERHLEHAISKKFSEIGIGPKVYESFPDHGLLMMEKLRPAIVDRNDPSQIKKIAELIARVHSVSIKQFPELPIKAHKYSAAREKLAAFFEVESDFSRHKEAFYFWCQLKDDLEGNVSSAVLCHNDAHIRNFLMSRSGNVVLIDNDHCSYGSGIYDLATSSIWLNLSASDERLFLQSYGTDLSDGLFIEYKKLVYLTYACMIFSFIGDYAGFDPSLVTEIHPSGYDKLPSGMSRDMRLYTLSCSYLNLYKNLQAAA